VFNFYRQITIPEARLFYGSQIYTEGVHNETYSGLITLFVKDEEERQQMFNAVRESTFVKAKADWTFKFMDEKTESLSARLIAFAFCEMVMFSSSFCIIFYFKRNGVLKGLTFSNELISRDEGMHGTFACELYKLMERVPQERVYEIFREGVRVEQEFVRSALPKPLLGLNAQDVCQYVEFVADYLLVMLGYPKLFNVSNPFDWMNMISVDGKTNFFERKVGEYSALRQNNTANTLEFDEDY
jgi:ribonucleotide reductase beta subunit family protein with ferritin-like domain